MKRWMQWLVTLATAGLLAACGGGGDNSNATSDNPTLAQALGNAPEASEFMKLVTASGLSGRLADEPAMTVLAPSNEALAAMGADIEALMQPENRAELEDFVNAHMVPRVLGEDELASVMPPDAADSLPDAQRLKAQSTSGTPMVAGSQQARNGVMYVIRLPLWRPPATLYLKLLPDFSILNQAVTAAGLGSAFNGGQPFTLLAPNNAAFADLLRELGLTTQQLLSNRALLTEVLTYHVLPAQLPSRRIADGDTAVTLQGQALTFDVQRRSGPDIRATDARGRSAGVVRADLFVRNGVLHAVDKVVLPQSQNLVQIAQGLPDFSILVNAVVAAGLVDTLSGPGPFTVFAPTNAAFAALLAELGVTAEQLLADRALLTQVLTYHVVPGRVLAADIRNGQQADTVQGQVFTLGTTGGVGITDARGRQARVVATDVAASNGVLHVIDRVILPQTRNIVEIAAGIGDFSILVEAVQAAGLADTLGGGEFTVFAPTNAAFAALLHELRITKAQLLANRSLLTQVLTYHVLPGTVLARDVPAGSTAVTTVQGERFTLTRSGASLHIRDARHRGANVTATDVQASNGVIHVMDRVILPRH